MDDADQINSLRENAVRLSMFVMGLQGFATQIIGHVRRGGVLDDEGLERIQKDTIASMKSTTATGLSDLQIAALLRNAIEDLRGFMSAIVVNARKDNL